MAMTMPQGLSLDPLVVDIQRLLKLGAQMYMCMTQATLDRHARDGEMPIRLGLRAYGEWRGQEMRAAHHAMGLEPNMRNLITCWDSASVFIVKDRQDTHADYKPYDTRFDVHLCPAAQAWKEADFHQWGHVYCDEFHQACAASYHPDGHVVIPLNLMKGDDHCHFQWVMPPTARTLDLGEPTELGHRLARDYQARSDVEGAWQALKRTNRLLGGRYATAAQVLIERFGERDARDTITNAMQNWGRLRGEQLRAEHQALGIEPSLYAFLSHHDLPLASVWDVDIHEQGRAHVAEIRDTPQDEVWRDLDAEDLAQLWYDSYAPMLTTYLPGTHQRWQRLKCRGDAVNELHIHCDQ